MLDTSFLIRLLNANNPLHSNAKGYFRYFLQEKIVLKCSTISIAEYCVKGKQDELPLRNIQILPFNFNHAVHAGRLVANYLESRMENTPPVPRPIVINDIKLYAQADTENEIEGFVTSDTAGRKRYNILNSISKLSFEYWECGLGSMCRIKVK